MFWAVENFFIGREVFFLLVENFLAGREFFVEII